MEICDSESFINVDIINPIGLTSSLNYMTINLLQSVQTPYMSFTILIKPVYL